MKRVYHNRTLFSVFKMFSRGFLILCFHKVAVLVVMLAKMAKMLCEVDCFLCNFWVGGLSPRPPKTDPVPGVAYGVTVSWPWPLHPWPLARALTLHLGPLRALALGRGRKFYLRNHGAIVGPCV